MDRLALFNLFDPSEGVRIGDTGKLPHWFQPSATYFVTIRTADSMPVEAIKRWHAQRDNWLKSNSVCSSNRNWRVAFEKLHIARRREYHETFSKIYFEELDKGYGECLLRNRECQQIVVDALMYFDGKRYHLGDFVIMPNHLHILVCLLEPTEIESQCESWKRFTARRINQLYGRHGRFWQEESFDHLVRSGEQLQAIQAYIANNPKHLAQTDFFLRRLE